MSVRFEEGRKQGGDAGGVNADDQADGPLVIGPQLLEDIAPELLHLGLEFLHAGSQLFKVLGFVHPKG